MPNKTVKENIEVIKSKPDTNSDNVELFQEEDGDFESKQVDPNTLKNENRPAQEVKASKDAYNAASESGKKLAVELEDILREYTNAKPVELLQEVLASSIN